MMTDATREARLDQLLDRQEIRECMERMCRGSDRCDKDLFVSAFHPGATVCVGPFVGTPEELYDWSGAMQEAGHRATLHGLLQTHCDIDGNVAHAETYYYFVGCGDETNLMAGGRYVDRFEKRDGKWGMVMRNNFIEWSGAAPAFTGSLGEVLDLEANGMPARDRSDPSYARPLVNKRARNIP